VTHVAGLVARLQNAARQAVADGEIGTARSIRFHVGASGGAPALDDLLEFGDVIFGGARDRVERTGDEHTGAALCVWERGQVATMTTADCDPPVVLLTVLCAKGALHFEERGP
jgi:hypothetical protein